MHYLNRLIIILLFASGYSSKTLSITDDLYKESYEAAVSHFKAEKYTEAEALFSQSIGYQSRMGQAISAYRLKNIKKSILLFKQTILLAEDDNERFLSLYNAASASFLNADYFEASKLFSDANQYKHNNIKTLEFIKLSTYLANLVKAQLARDNATSKKKKSSEGKKTISSDDLVFDESINLRLEDSESTLSKTTSDIQLSISENLLITNLVNAGVNTIKINESGKAQELPSSIDLDIVYEFSNLDHAAYTPFTSIPTLWKRMFEQEVGFPAELELAEDTPGVRPW